MEIVNMRTKDGIALKGLLYESLVNNEICLFIPGCCGNFVDNDFMRIISEILYENGYNVLCANTRGSFMMNSSFHPYNLERPKKIGVAYEKFEDCVNDIDGWISYLKDRGYSSVNVISHSSGANKLIYYMNYNLENKQLINKIVMLSPPDFMNRIRCYPDFQDLVNEATYNIINGEPDKMMKIHFFYKTSQSFIDMINSKNFDNLPLVNGNEKDFEQYAKIDKPIVIICGSEEKYIKNYADKFIKYAAPGNQVEFYVINKADHIYFGKEHVVAYQIIIGLSKLRNNIQYQSKKLKLK